VLIYDWNLNMLPRVYMPTNYVANRPDKGMRAQPFQTAGNG
jgi:hypothetical protein